MKKQYYTFVLNFGYVESACLSFLPFTSQNKYATAKEALKDLAFFLKEIFTSKVALKKTCCATNKGKFPDAKFCSECGSLFQDSAFDPESFMDWLVGISHYDNDSFISVFDYDPAQRWQSNGLEGAPNQVFVYSAEWVLAAAIGYPHNVTTFDEICKRRTKNKSKCFEW